MLQPSQPGASGSGPETDSFTVEHLELGQEKERLRRRQAQLNELKADLKSSEDRLNSAKAQLSLVGGKASEVADELGTYSTYTVSNGLNRITQQDENDLEKEFSQIISSFFEGVRTMQTLDEEASYRLKLEHQAKAAAVALGSDVTSNDLLALTAEESTKEDQADDTSVDVTYYQPRDADGNAGLVRLADSADVDDGAITCTCARRTPARNSDLLFPLFFGISCLRCNPSPPRLTPSAPRPIPRSPRARRVLLPRPQVRHVPLRGSAGTR